MKEITNNKLNGCSKTFLERKIQTAD